ncbi:unnamed protein product [Cylicostephanus goldi]|uniref:Serpin domain-containing protein n=1 Tax=Cylicostephanus goldi TaxID=71465 RepID=A0A3P7MF23_CYLGO|nr:unnamed protein product [Cylicostephanus goldi]
MHQNYFFAQTSRKARCLLLFLESAAALLWYLTHRYVHTAKFNTVIANASFLLRLDFLSKKIFGSTHPAVGRTQILRPKICDSVPRNDRRCKHAQYSSPFLTAETDFGLEMLRQKTPDECTVVSPLSVIFALNMVQAGAEGTTKSQIIDLISKGVSSIKTHKSEIVKSKLESAGSSDDDTLQFYSDLMRQILDSTSNAQIRIANGFFFR